MAVIVYGANGVMHFFCGFCIALCTVKKDKGAMIRLPKCQLRSPGIMGFKGVIIDFVKIKLK